MLTTTNVLVDHHLRKSSVSTAVAGFFISPSIGDALFIPTIETIETIVPIAIYTKHLTIDSWYWTSNGLPETAVDTIVEWAQSNFKTWFPAVQHQLDTQFTNSRNSIKCDIENSQILENITISNFESTSFVYLPSSK